MNVVRPKRHVIAPQKISEPIEKSFRRPLLIENLNVIDKDAFYLFPRPHKPDPRKESLYKK